MSSEKLLPVLRGLFSRVSTMSLATVDAFGMPHACNLNYVADDACNLYFISHPESAHSVHIAARSGVAGTVYAPFDKPSQILGVQFRGVCAATDPADFDRIWAMYCRKFSYAPQLEERARAERFYRVSPTWFRTIDNSVHFGFRLESEWPPK